MAISFFFFFAIESLRNSLPSLCILPCTPMGLRHCCSWMAAPMSTMYIHAGHHLLRFPPISAPPLLFFFLKKVQNWSDCHGGLKQYSTPDCKDKKAECNSCCAPQKQKKKYFTNKEIKTFIQHQFYNSKHYFIFCFFIEYGFLENAYQILFSLFPLYFPPHHTLKSVPLHFLFRRE